MGILRKSENRKARKSRRQNRTGLPPGTLLNEPSVHGETGYELFEFSPEDYTEEHGTGLPDLGIFGGAREESTAGEGSRAGEVGIAVEGAIAGERAAEGNAERRDRVIWLNVTGVENGDLLSRLGQSLGIHPVVLEDIQNTVQRPKCEEYEDFSFLVFRMLRRADTGQPIGRGGMEGAIESEQISLLLGENYVISFQERPGDVFGHVRNRIRSGKGRVRRQGADYLAYVLMDLVVDGYLLLLEDIEEELEDLEDLLDERRTAEIPGRLRHAKAELVDVRRAVRPLREVVELLLKEESTHFREETEPYLRDLGDHTHRAIDTVELLKEMQSIVGGSYQAALSNDMNSVMKVLTIIATIFIPLTFVAGIYGMNFQHMPELSLPWAYPAVLGVMGAIVVGMLIYFRRKGWL